MNNPLTVGIILRGTSVPAWQGRVLELIHAADYATIVSVEIKGGKGIRPSLIYRTFRHVLPAGRQPTPDACAPIDVHSLLGPEVKVWHADRPDSEMSITGEDLDVVIDLTGDAPDGRQSVAGRFGTLYYGYRGAALGPDSGATPGYLELIRREGTIHSALYWLNRAGDTEYVAYESWSGVHRLSLARTRNELLWKLSCFAPRVLERLHREGGDAVQQALPVTPRPLWSTGIQSRWIRLLALVNEAASMVAYLAVRLGFKLRAARATERWILMCGQAGDPAGVRGLKPILPPPDRFWADPFLVRRGDRTYVLFEDASVATGRGRLSSMEIGINGSFGDAVVVLEKPYHLSYPFLFERGGELYMIPESAEHGTVDLYRCREFPNDWQFVKTLLDGVDAYDATLVPHGGRWWMFVNLKAHPGMSSWDELYLFHSDDPIEGVWQSHPANPVISDVRRARPAGAVFDRDGALCRPSQDSSFRYGFGLNFNRIVELTPARFREQIVEKWEPGWDPSIRAIHTFAQHRDLVVVDAIQSARPVRRR